MRVDLEHTTWRTITLASLLVFTCTSSFTQSVQKDPVTGLTTRGKGLSCDEVYLSDGEKIIQQNTFIYGETFYLNFDGMEGFERAEERAFPEMQMVVISQEGDTTFSLGNLYADYKDGVEQSPLQLHAKLTMADPMHSGNTYTMHVHVQDKRGKGTCHATLDFTVEKDERIEVSGEQLTSEEIYLFSQQRGHTITNGKAGYNENIYLLFEGLDGFSVDAGQVQLGLSLLLEDAFGNVILDEADLFGDDPLKIEDVHLQVASNFILTGTEVANPVRFSVRIRDKNSPSWINASTELLIE